MSIETSLLPTNLKKINSVSIERHFLVSISDTSRKIIVRIAEWLESQWILML